MIDSLPEYGLTCYCGMRISGTNEKGLVSLLKKHIASGVFHTAYMSVYKINYNDTDLEKFLAEVTALRKGEDYANTPR